MSEPRDRELSRIYRDADAPEPPQRIDDAILAASRRAAGAGPRSARTGLARRWHMPVALAASVILAVTLTLMVLEQPSEPETMQSVPVMRDPAAPGAGAPAQLPSAESRPAVPAAAKPMPKAATRRDAGGKRPGERTDEGAGAGAPAFVADVPRAPEVVRESRQLREPQRMPPQATQPAPAAAASETGPARGASPALQGGARDEARRSRSAETGERSPQAWLEDIRRLKAQGRMPEAERELAAFKRRYPDYRLPEDFR